jgi:hypothetical protein
LPNTKIFATIELLTGYAGFSDRLKTGVPQAGQLWIQKIFQRIKKRPTDKVSSCDKTLCKKLLNPLVVCDRRFFHPLAAKKFRLRP